MNREKIETKSEEEWLRARTKDVTSTEVSALFGLSPYMTAYELWHRKKDQTFVEFKDNERMRWGRRLETSIAEGVAEDLGILIRPMKEYIRIPEIRMGASFDVAVQEEIIVDVEPRPVSTDPGALNYAGGKTKEYKDIGIIEIKNVDALVFRDSWLKDGVEGSAEAPPHIELQVQAQLGITRLGFNIIAALVGGNEVHIIRRVPDETIIQQIETKIAEFWKSIEANIPPPIDLLKDADFLIALNNYSEPGKQLYAQNDEDIRQLALAYKDVSGSIKHCEESKKAIKAQILMAIGDHEKVIGDGFTITTGMIGPAHIEYDRSPYRGFRVNWRKVKS